MNFIHTLKRIFSDKGLLLTLVLSLGVLFGFYGKLLRHPCSTYFGVSGDGMQIYYETLYHTKYDTEFWKQKSINYPYGESIFFTGAMPFVNNAVKIFGPSAAPLGVGLINLMMLFSPVIGALFIYAIFRHLRLPWHYGGICATAIAFLSPQLERFSGHYSLAWVFLIPAILYLLLRFYDYPSLKKSFLIAFFVFLGATTHLYFLAFFAAIMGFYWAVLFLTRDRGFGRMIFALKHFAIQFILPVLVLESISIMTNSVTDRTAAPWGYLIFHSNNSGVFFPFGLPYENIFRKFFDPEQVEFEGQAYVGLAAMTGLLAIILVQLYRIVRGRINLILSVTDHKVLNIFFWTSLVLLWISYGKPFVDDHQEWLIHLGPLRQFRSIGRLNWIFFYVINIIAVYRIYKISQKKKILNYIALISIPGMLILDSTYHLIHVQQNTFNNKIVELEDETNQLSQNAWLREFNVSAYQAILPLPYFHGGSENLGKQSPDQEIVFYSYIVSLKTGLPLMSVMSARVSISQTVKMLPLVLDPILPIPVLKDLPDNRPLLLVVRPDSLNENERRILSLAKKVASSNDYQLYSLLPSDLANMVKNQYDSVKNDFTLAKKYDQEEFISSDSNTYYVHRMYENEKGKAFRGKGAFSGSMRDYCVLYDSSMAAPGYYTGNFWVRNIDKDLYPRAVIEVVARDTSGVAKTFYYYSNVFWNLRAIDGSWGLVEFPITVPCENAQLKITIWNYEMKREDLFEADELLIRPLNTDLYQIKGDTIFRNNRYYFPLK